VEGGVLTAPGFAGGLPRAWNSMLEQPRQSRGLQDLLIYVFSHVTALNRRRL
jgi:hypothetical protein